MARTNEALRMSTTKVLRVAFLSALVLDTLGSVSVALVAVPLGLRLLTGGVHLSAALAVLIIAPEVFLPLRRASAEFHESSEGLAASARAMAIIGSSPVPAGRTGITVPGPVELRSVTVELPGREVPLLREVSLTISPGETVVLVGPSGAGKSTVISLLLALASPGAGRVTAGGQDLRDIDPAAWRRLITYLPERPTLLAASLADNLRLANLRRATTTSPGPWHRRARRSCGRFGAGLGDEAGRRGPAGLGGRTATHRLGSGVPTPAPAVPPGRADGAPRPSRGSSCAGGLAPGPESQ